MRSERPRCWKHAFLDLAMRFHSRLNKAQILLIVPCIVFVLMWAGAVTALPNSAADAPSEDPIGLRVVLDEGEIVIALDRAAAPDTIRTILDLVGSSAQPEGETAGYYDGLTVDHTWPHIEIGTGVRKGRTVVIPQEIDAGSLGLDTEKITKSSIAMNLWQFEFAEANERWKAEGSRPKQFEEWFQIFSETNSVDFLMEVSRQEINEVLGYRYVSGRQSLPARRGFVYLKPISATENSPALRILLTDRPQLDGRVTVIGRVVEGLELAQELSVTELKTLRSRPIFEPVDPVVIRRTEPIELTEPSATSSLRDGACEKAINSRDGQSNGATEPNNLPPGAVESQGGSQ